MLGGDEVIALIEVAVVLDDRHIAAGGTEDAQRMAQPIGRPRGFFEDLDDDPPDVVPDPFVEDRAEEAAEGLGRHRTLAHAAGSARPRLHQGYEAEVLGPDLLEEVIDLERVLHVLRVHHAEQVHGDLVPPQQAIALHHLPMRRPSGLSSRDTRRAVLSVRRGSARRRTSRPQRSGTTPLSAVRRWSGCCWRCACRRDSVCAGVPRSGGSSPARESSVRRRARRRGPRAPAPSQSAGRCTSSRRSSGIRKDLLSG